MSTVRYRATDRLLGNHDRRLQDEQTLNLPNQIRVREQQQHRNAVTSSIHNLPEVPPERRLHPLQHTIGRRHQRLRGAIIIIIIDEQLVNFVVSIDTMMLA